jgi:hypothetical protein
VAHTCNSSYSGGRDQEDHGSTSARQTQQQQKFNRTPFSTHKQDMVHTPAISAMWKVEIGGSWSRPAQPKDETIVEK